MCLQFHRVQFRCKYKHFHLNRILQLSLYFFVIITHYTLLSENSGSEIICIFAEKFNLKNKISEQVRYFCFIC